MPSGKMFCAIGVENCINRVLSGFPAWEAPLSALDVGDIAANKTATAQNCLTKLDVFGLTPLGRLIGLTAVADFDLTMLLLDDNLVNRLGMRLLRFFVVLWLSLSARQLSFVLVLLRPGL